MATWRSIEIVGFVEPLATPREVLAESVERLPAQAGTFVVV
jgi:hypothetical protein